MYTHFKLHTFLENTFQVEFNIYLGACVSIFDSNKMGPTFKKVKMVAFHDECGR